jgi:transcriptional regulator with XRE-family HTH domain
VSNDTDLIRQELWESFRDKARRDAFVSSHISNNTGAQIFALRESRGWSQEKLASETGMAQPRISILEGGYENYSLRTLKRFASAFDVALVVRFVPFSELLDWVTDISEEKLAPVGFANDNISERRDARHGDHMSLSLEARGPSYASALDALLKASAPASEMNIYDFYKSVPNTLFLPTGETVPTISRKTDTTSIDNMFLPPPLTSPSLTYGYFNHYGDGRNV